MRKGKKVAITGFGALLAVLLVFAVFFYFNFKTVQVSGISMMPTLKDGQRVLVSKAYWLVGPIGKKDIIVIRDDTPTGFFIKRVHFLPGDKVDWKYLPNDWEFTKGPMTVPEGKYFVIGDNKPHSEDSRTLGPVDAKDVLGKVVVWP